MTVPAISDHGLKTDVKRVHGCFAGGTAPRKKAGAEKDDTLETQQDLVY